MTYKICYDLLMLMWLMKLETRCEVTEQDFFWCETDTSTVGLLSQVSTSPGDAL